MPTYRVTDSSGGRELYLAECDATSAAAEWLLRIVRREPASQLDWECVVRDAWGGEVRVDLRLEITAHATPIVEALPSCN